EELAHVVLAVQRNGGGHIDHGAVFRKIVHHCFHIVVVMRIDEGAYYFFWGHGFLQGGFFGSCCACSGAMGVMRASTRWRASCSSLRFRVRASRSPRASHRARSG